MGLGFLSDPSSSHIKSHISTHREVNRTSMGITNFVLTVAGVSAVVLLLRSDVKKSASIFRQNVKQIRHWLEEETPNPSK